MQNNEKPIVLSVVLFVISMVVALLLAFTNSITEDKIAENKIEEQNAAKQEVLPTAVQFIEKEFEDDEDISNFQPIPLTQEILEKNFTMYDLEYFIPEYPNHNPEENDYFSIYYNKHSGLSTIWKLEYIDGFYYDIETKSVSIISIKYVHDLQHFLKSCVIDKEIKL